MSTDKRKEPPQAGPSGPVAEAGHILRGIGVRELYAMSRNPTGSSLSIDQELQYVRHLLSQVKPNSDADRHRYLAAKTALETLEVNERGDVPLPYLDQFYGHVEAVRGGKGAEIFGGARITNKPDVTTAFMRAALFVLWEHYQGDDTARSALVREAVSLCIIGNRTDSQAKNEAVVKTRINNISKRPHDGQRAVAPEWEHIDLVRGLVTTAGYRSLADFR